METVNAIEFFTPEFLVLEIEKYRKRIIAFMLQYKNNKGYWDEIISELQLKVLENNTSNVRKDNIINWMINCVRHKNIDKYRTRYTRFVVTFTDKDGHSSQDRYDNCLKNFHETPDYDNKGKDLRAFLERSKLNEKFKELLILFYLENYSYKEIEYAEFYKCLIKYKDINESKIKNRLFRGRNELRELLQFKGIKSYHEAIKVFNI
ncbi:MAG: hypothetical protein PHW73_01065 [Atribacterota bacterium]|nr:hypothetical protein [Atribacterota bacterium]